MKIIKLPFVLLAALLACNAMAQAPTGYYDNAQGLTGQNLKVALHDIIKGHTTITYSQLWDAYYDTDRKPNGKIWDVYSDVPGGTPPYEFSYGTDQCGSINYNSEDDCYNREHTFPKSYFNSNMPMYSDLYIVYPTDGYVNNKRFNYPYGEVSNANWTSENGSKLGPNAFAGSGGGTCFEPIDSFKGDLARTYFYIATRYYGQDGGWDNWAMANGAELKPWAVQMLLEWSHNDPVSKKEIDRNNAIFTIQHNRNPFIDHPEWIDCIWSNTNCDTSSSLNNLSEINNSVNIYPNPASEYVNVEITESNHKGGSAVLYNLQGQAVYHQNINNNIQYLQFDVTSYAAGVYYLKIVLGNEYAIKKVVVK